MTGISVDTFNIKHSVDVDIIYTVTKLLYNAIQR